MVSFIAYIEQIFYNFYYFLIGMATTQRVIYENAIDKAEKTAELSVNLMLKWCAPSYALPVIFYSLYMYYVRGAAESSFEVIFYMAYVPSVRVDSSMSRYHFT